MTEYGKDLTIKGVSVTLALKYDGAVPAPVENCIGHLTTGPQGFLRLLETQLGIPGDEASFTTRLIQYLACLESANTEQRFFHASYAADPFSVARTLLQWRDQWYLAGWRGSFGSDVPPRLADMADVEREAQSGVAPGPGQRIQRVLDLLPEHRIAVERIELHDDLEHFPHLWRTLVEATGAPVSRAAPIAAGADEATDLGRLQQRLLNGGTGKIALQGDGSFIAIHAATARESAPLVSHLTRQWLDEGQTGTALLAEVRGSQLDEAMEAGGACRLGFNEYSPWRPIFQVLPLALDLLWAPLSASTLLKFLSHPVAPIPRRIREVLAQVAAGTPGIGSEAWQAAVDGCLAAEDEDKQAGYREAITQWLEPARHDPDTGIPPAGLAARARQVSDWLMGIRESAAEPALQSLYAVASNQVTEFIEAVHRLDEHGYQQLTRDNVRRLLEDVRGTGSPLVDRGAEVLPGQPRLLRAEHAGSVTRALDQLIWWDCQASDRVHRWPWNRAERAALAGNGVHLQSEDQQLAWLGQAWLRPILAARCRCILVLHGDAERHHPVWDHISSIVKPLVPYHQDDPALAALLAPRLEPLAPRHLPGKQRWWRLPESASIPARSRESYSSLDAFIYSPYQWLLKYPARIRPGSLAVLAEGNLLKGNLAHRLFEAYFTAHPAIAGNDTAAIDPWVDEYVYALLAQEGATLLEAGQQADCERFIAQAKDGLATLVNHLQQAGVTRVDTELQQSGHFGGGELTGYIDLLATRADGREAVVDIKWGGLKFRRESLQASHYLQLATYALFRQQGAGQPLPALSFFIINDAEMLSLDHDFFPGALAITPDNGEGWGEFWQRFEQGWRWRRAQLDAGLVEVSISDTAPSDDSLPPEAALPVPEASDTFNDYAVLTGWEPGA